MPSATNPYLYIVLDGMLRLHTPSGIMDYMAGQYSVSKIDTPLMGKVLNFSEQQDFLAPAIEFTVNDVITTVLSLDNDLTEKIMNEQLESQKMAMSDEAVIESVYRLLNGIIAGGIGIGGGTEEQDCEIAEHVVSVFERLAC
jgi:hypothetical protein